MKLMFWCFLLLGFSQLVVAAQPQQVQLPAPARIVVDHAVSKKHDKGACSKVKVGMTCFWFGNQLSPEFAAQGLTVNRYHDPAPGDVWWAQIDDPTRPLSEYSGTTKLKKLDEVKITTYYRPEEGPFKDGLALEIIFPNGSKQYRLFTSRGALKLPGMLKWMLMKN